MATDATEGAALEHLSVATIRTLDGRERAAERARSVLGSATSDSPRA